MVIEIYKQKNFFVIKVLLSKFYYHGNDMELLMKFYTINHSHYYHLIPLTKQTMKVWVLRLNST